MGEFKVIFVPRANEDLKDIVRFVAFQNSGEVAERLGLQLIEKALNNIPRKRASCAGVKGRRRPGNLFQNVSNSFSSAGSIRGSSALLARSPRDAGD